MYNKKVFILLLTTLMVLNVYLLLGCGMHIFEDTDKKIDMNFEQIISTIKNKDNDTLKTMFSKQALSKNNNFDENIDNLFGFIKGEITSWKRTGGPSRSVSINGDGTGLIWEEVRATYDIVTDEQIYHTSLQVITKYSQNADMVGISSFCIINSVDWNEEYNYWGDLGRSNDFVMLGIIIDQKAQ